MTAKKLSAALLALCVVPYAAAQSVGASDESFIRGRAAYSPAMTLTLLKKVEGFCATADKSAHDMLFAAVAAWQQRHADLLRENALVLAELQAEVNAPAAPPGLKAQLDGMLNQRVPQQVETDFKKLVPAESTRGWASKAFVCGANASTIEQGQHDLERVDPEVAAYLRKRLARSASVTTH
jgi:hypothetical protein